MAVRNIGIPGIEPPKNRCDDPKCPWHGHLKVRGAIITGTVISAKMHRTVIVRHDYLFYVRKYKRYEKRHTKIHAHNPPCINAQEGDVVIVGETRPLSKTVHFVVLGVVKRAEERGGK